MKEKILSSEINRGTWYRTNGREDLIQAVQELINDNVCLEFNDDKTMFRKGLNYVEKKQDKPYTDFFEWANGREDCHIETRQLGYGKVCYDLYQGNKLLAIR